jgi:hypothetical protein
MISLKAEDLYLNRINNTTISSWNDYSCVAVGGHALPLYMCDENMPYVRLGSSSATSSVGNYIDLGPQTFNEQINGLTIFAFARMNASKAGSRIFDFGNGANSSNILLYQNGASVQWAFSYWNTSSTYVEFVGTLIFARWYLYAVRIKPSSMDIAVNGYTLSTSTFSTDRSGVRNNCYVGRSNWDADSYPDLDLRELTIYFRALSDAEMTSEISRIRIKYGILRVPYSPSTSISSYLGFFSASTNVSLKTQYQYLYSLVVSGSSIRMSDLLMMPRDTYAWYTAASFANNIWSDVSGNNRHVVNITGTLSSSVVSGVGCVTGSATTKIKWPSDVLPQTYTLFHVCRHNGINRGRILTSDSNSAQNWLSGFDSGPLIGIAYHDGWITASSSSLPVDTWMVSTDTNTMYRSNGQSTTTIIGPGSSTNITVNYSANLSDFAIAEVIVYNSNLPVSEISRVEQYLSSKYNLPIANRTMLGVTSANLLALYSARQLNFRYNGRLVRLKRSTDSAISDFYGDVYGNLTLGFGGQGTTLDAWKGAGTLLILTWYDQSGNSKHLTCTGASFNANGSVIMTGSMMSGPQIFPTSSVTSMHMIFSFAISSLTTAMSPRLLNSGDTERFSCHTPYTSGKTYYFDAGNPTSLRCRESAAATDLNTRYIFSGYTNPGERVGLRINQGIRRLSSGNASAATSDGFFLHPGDRNNYWDIAIYSNKLSASDETMVENLVWSSLQYNL